MIPLRHISTILFLSTSARLQAQTAETKKPAEVEETPLTLPGAESIAFKKVDDGDLLLHVIKPKDAKASEKRPCLVAFFGGGWSTGTPAKSITWAKWASKLGMVGIAPDYRTKSRFKATPEDSVADGRSAVRWIQDHASELGIDPAKIVVLGSSAGGRLPRKKDRDRTLRSKFYGVVDEIDEDLPKAQRVSADEEWVDNLCLETE